MWTEGCYSDGESVLDLETVKQSVGEALEEKKKKKKKKNVAFFSSESLS